MGFKEEMAALDAEYEETEAAADTGGGVIPDGNGQALIVELRLEENDHGWAVVGKFRNAIGSIRRWWSLPPTAAQLPYFKKDMQLLGFDGKPSEIEDWLEGEHALFRVAHIGVKTKPGDERDFTDVYLNAVSDEVMEEDYWQSLTEWNQSGGQRRRTAQGGGGGSSSSSADADFQGADDDIPF